MQLVVAEKPSVGRDLARVLGVGGSGRHALADSRRVITWCIGHLVELDEPASYDARWKPWRLDSLPMIPSTFRLRPTDGTRDQFKAVQELLRDRRFSEVVNACDAGREGELIFRYVYELAGCRLPVRRLWISSLTDEAIRGGFAGLRPGAEYDPLADAARCRSEADWLVGMNATRAVTIARRGHSPSSAATASRGRGKHSGAKQSPVYSIGRVQTPTLAIVVKREQAISSFRPQDYWEVRGTFSDGKASFVALWGTGAAAGGATVTRLGKRELADQIVARTRAFVADGNGPGAVVEKVSQKKSREPPPQLFDLTSLQRTANRRYGFSATRTLEAAQALYERHKLLTYPRTDSRYLSQDMAGELPRLFRGLAEMPEYAPHAQPLLAAPPPNSRRVFDATKVHDHHAIIPTGKVARLESLPADERRIFDLVVRRFLGVFHPDAEFALTQVVVRVGARDGGNAPASASTLPARGPAPTDHSATAAGAAPHGSGDDEAALLALSPPPDRFVARGRVRLFPGWQDVAQISERGRDEEPDKGEQKGRGARGEAHHDPRAIAGTLPEGDGDRPAVLPPLTEGQRLTGVFDPLTKQTKPPPRHTDASLLGAMEYAGRDIVDDALRAAMKDTGLGTPATRAATIETLVRRGFVVRNGKQISATTMGVDLIESLPVPSLASPELTGAWEARLARISRRQEARTSFMEDISHYVRDLVDAIRRSPTGGALAAVPDRAPPDRVATAAVPDGAAPVQQHAAKVTATRPRRLRTGGPRGGAAAVSGPLVCPRCKDGTLVTGKRGWGCSRWRDGCAFVIWFTIDGRRITEAQLRDLVVKGKTRMVRKARASGNTPSGAHQGDGNGPAGRLVLEVAAPSETGAARFEPALEPPR